MANNILLNSDNFISGSLAAGWGVFPTFSKCQVVAGSPNATEPNVAGTTAGQVWTGFTSNDQISEVTIKNLASGGTITLTTRVTATASGSGYLASLSGAGGSLQVFRDDNGTLTQLGSTVTLLTFAAGDVWTFAAVGSALFVYQNGKRIFYFYDATYPTGNPGYNQSATTTLSTSQVSAWRGYSAAQQDGIWQKQGIVVPGIASDYSGSPTGQGLQSLAVIREGNAQLLSGTVFKTWAWNPASGNTYYLESTDGVSWTRKAAAVLTGFLNTSIFKNGSTYYAYCQTNAGNGSGTIQVFTSADGITWAQQTPTNTISLGTAGQWDAAAIYPFEVIGIVAGTWYGYYLGTNNTSTFLASTGLVNSTDGINWTKYVSNPVIANVLSSGCTANVNGTWYMWVQANQPGQGDAHAPGLDPTEMVRYKSTDLINWTKSAHSVHASQMWESLNTTRGQVYPVGIVDFNGKAYLYLNAVPSDGVNPVASQIELAIGPAPTASIVTQNEDAVSQVATDGFTSGIGNLSANWTTPTGSTKLQIVAGNLCEASALTTTCAMAYTGAAFSANQYSEITIAALTNSSQFVEPLVRAQTTSNSWYGLNLLGPTGSGSAGDFAIVKIISGVQTTLGPTAQVTPQVGDVFRLAVVTGSDGFPVLSAYQNGFLILQVQDFSNALTSGSPGMAIFATTSLADAQLSLWAGGNASVIPTYPSLIGWVNRQRSFVNKR